MVDGDGRSKMGWSEPTGGPSAVSNLGEAGPWMEALFSLDQNSQTTWYTLRPRFFWSGQSFS